MIVLKKGVSPFPAAEKPWWIGLVVVCDRCGTIMELDEADGRFAREVDEPTGVIKKVNVSCPICSRLVGVPRPVAQTSLDKYRASRTLIPA